MAKLYKTDHGAAESPKPCVLFLCPGCNLPHCVVVGGSGAIVWQWNQDVEKPTFSPSILVTDDTDRCHSFVRDGKIEFLGDSTHGLAGKTVDLPEFGWGD